MTRNSLSNDVAKGLDDTMEALRWCKRHLHDRRALDALRLIQLNLAYLALALDWEMEGEGAKAASALDRLWWQPHKEDSSWIGDATITGH